MMDKQHVAGVMSFIPQDPVLLFIDNCVKLWYNKVTERMKMLKTKIAADGKE